VEGDSSTLLEEDMDTLDESCSIMLEDVLNTVVCTLSDIELVCSMPLEGDDVDEEGVVISMLLEVPVDDSEAVGSTLLEEVNVLDAIL
jgi:hypothetical protein